jgi:hypothetical protein
VHDDERAGARAVPRRVGLELGAWSTVKFGSKPASCSSVGRMNMFRTKAACHALGRT